MATTDDKVTASRILVALETPLQSLAALRAAAPLAAQLGAELVALFVEDVNLIHLAGLPFAREVDSASGLERSLDDIQMARRLRAQLQQVERVLAQAAAELELASSLRVVRGHFPAEAVAAIGEADVLYLCRRQHQSREISADGYRPARTRAAERHGVWVVFDGSPAGERALRVAGRLAGQAPGELVVVLAVAELDQGEALKGQAKNLLGTLGATPHFLRMPMVGTDDLLPILRQHKSGLLVMPKPLQSSQMDARTLLERTGCPMLLVS